MPKYAYFDAATGSILNWMDTDSFSYDSMPSEDTLLPLTDDQWAARFTENNIVQNGALVAYTAPVLTSEQQMGDAKSAKSTDINTACTAQIMAGVVSTALGEAHTYPTKPTDQSNLSASVLDSLLPDNASNTSYATPFWCCDANGKWAWVMHTAAQIQQVGRDVKASILAAQGKNAQLQAQITAATTVAAVNAITW